MKTKLIKILTPLPSCRCWLAGKRPFQCQRRIRRQSRIRRQIRCRFFESAFGKTYSAQDLKVLSVSETPVKGIYEVVVSGRQIIYTDAEGGYMFVGELINIDTRKT